MLQYITQKSNCYSVADQMQMAIEGGCTWIVLSHDSVENDEELRTLSEEFLPLCRESQVILTFENRAEAARELGIHGVWMTCPECNAAKFREDLGAEAIIGVQISGAMGAIALKALDIDYVSLPSGMKQAHVKELVDEVRQASCDIPIVLTGDIALDDIPALMETGISGIATGKHILQSDNPAEMTARMIAVLQESQH